MLNGTYLEGDSLLHRARPVVKLGWLLAVTLVVMVWSTPAVVLGVAASIVLVGCVAGPGGRTTWALVRATRWIVLVLTPVQLWTAGWDRAVVVVVGLVGAIVAAGLVSVTTRVADMMDTVVTGLCPVARLGVDVDRIGLALGLAMRAIPVVTRTVTECAEARRARGLERSPRALLVPVVVRTVRHAENVGEALVARGLDDG